MITLTQPADSSILQAQISTLEQLLEVHESTAVEQAERLEEALRERRYAEEKLKAAYEDLELRVQERTAELSRAVVELAGEIQERRRIESALRDSENQFRSLFEDAPVAYHEIDRDGIVHRVNRAECALLNLTASEIVGKPVWDLVAPEQQEVSRLATLRKLAGEEPLGVFHRSYVKRDGERLTLEIHEDLLRDKEGTVRGIRSTLFDITDRQRAEEELHRAKEAAEAASRAKSEFLANMSHEIRTPMNGVIGMTELALSTPLNGEQKEYLTMVKDSADSLLTVINDILDFSKIEAGKLDLENIPFHFHDSLAAAMKALGIRAHQKGIELAYEVASGIPATLVGDAARLRQVIVNLVGNAIKFTQRGEVVVRVETERTENRETLLHFTVRDTGIGIPAGQQQKIFEAFEQCDNSVARRYGGTGLGLAISSQLVKLMGGRISVESHLGEGSTFHFTARFGISDRSFAPPATAELAGMPVLVVDDNATNRRILVELLTRWGARPEAVSGGAQALDKLEQACGQDRPFALVLTDAHMPGMNGFELAIRIRENPGLAAPAILMLTSDGLPGDTERCRTLSVAAYLIKPIDPAELAAAMTRSIGLRPEGPSEPAAPAPVPEASGGLRILLAEDNAINQRLATSVLNKLGHTVVVRDNGREALHALEEQSFDLVLMDVHMPELDGYRTTARIRSQEMHTRRHMKIVAMTASAMKGDRELCLAAGMDGYISKPIHMQDLQLELQRVVSLPSSV